MIHRVGACLFVSFFAVGCGVGDDDVLPNDPNPDNLVCTDAFKVTGSFVAGTPERPITDPENPTDPFTGCWPVGTWNFTASLDPGDENVVDITGDQVGDRCGAVGGTQAATFDASYSFTVNRTDDGDGWVDSYVLNGAVQEGEQWRWNDKLLFRLKVTEGGGGECEGGLELYSADGKSYWNLKPALTGNAISGFGDFKLYEESQN
jgi:hypothetical protein